MAKLVLSDITSGYNSTVRINAAFAALEAALENTLSRDGSTPNSMGASLDMNSNRILNVGSPQSATDAARWADVTGALSVSTPMPSQTGNSGKYVTTDGTNLSFAEAYAKWQRTGREVSASKTPSSYFYSPDPLVDIRRYGAVGDNSTDCTTAIQDAVAVAAVIGGTVYIPNGSWKITGDIELSARVNIRGEGYGSLLKPVSTDCFTFNFYTSFGKVVLSDFAIDGTTCTTHKAIYQIGSLNDADELYGLTMERVLIRNYQTCVDLRQVRVCTINNCWFEHTNIGVNLTGKNLVFNITGTEMVHGTGCGTGDKIGIWLRLYNFTSGSGLVGPEGQLIRRNQIYGFERGIKAEYCFFTDIEANDFVATVVGIEFETCQYNLNIKQNYIEMQTSSALQGIYGLGLASPIFTKVNIEGNGINAANTTTNCSGIQINGSANQNQNFVSTVRNWINNMDTFDIIYYAAGHGNIEDNRCQSSSPTYSIRVDSVEDGVVYIDKNICAKDIYFDPAEAASGEVVYRTNYENGTTIQHGPQTVPTVASAGTLVLPNGVNIFLVTGSTTITSITATGWAGREVTLISSGGTWTLQDGGNLKLASNFVATSDDTIRLVCDGTNWYAAGGPSAN